MLGCKKEVGFCIEDRIGDVELSPTNRRRFVVHFSLNAREPDVTSLTEYSVSVNTREAGLPN
jgi:hypothetical protein